MFCTGCSESKMIMQARSHNLKNDGTYSRRHEPVRSRCWKCKRPGCTDGLQIAGVRVLCRKVVGRRVRMRGRVAERPQ